LRLGHIDCLCVTSVETLKLSILIISNSAIATLTMPQTVQQINGDLRINQLNTLSYVFYCKWPTETHRDVRTFQSDGIANSHCPKFDLGRWNQFRNPAASAINDDWSHEPSGQTSNLNFRAWQGFLLWLSQVISKLVLNSGFPLSQYRLQPFPAFDRSTSTDRCQRGCDCVCEQPPG
jgi:hypothetical protein